MSSTNDLDRLLARHPAGIDIHARLDPLAIGTVRAVALRLNEHAGPKTAGLHPKVLRAEPIPFSSLNALILQS